ncbi:SDR family oxidoreductase [Pseudooceanicola sp. LIPI14-2-Ac024]|uniref:SDR family oxidoreductase n=1 Tax=Pseudooceanicola sp. LIPI14-2-Ac024 TaxID=3344875 RepID=UPI0035D0F21C
MTIAVTGATGQLGRKVIAQLKDKGVTEVIALARSPEKAADLGVTVRVADYDRPETLAPALAGVDTLLLISSSEVGKRAVQHAAIIEAARAASVGHIVYTSILNADINPLSLAEEHRATEAALAASGIPTTLLRNGWYTENYASNAPMAVTHGAVLGSAGEGRISGAARDDYAAAAVAVLTGSGHAGKTYELAGDGDFTLADLAAEITAQSGTPVVYTDLPAPEYAKVLEGVGLDAGLAGAIAGWDADAANGALQSDDGTLSRLIGRPTTPLSEVVKAALAT